MSKTAVILFNLGGPGSLNEVESFLFNLFFDKEIIRLPKFLRYFIAKIISKSRKKTATEIYEKLGGKSPIYEETLAQKDQLSKKLGENFEVFIAMRHASPRVDEVIKIIKKVWYFEIKVFTELIMGHLDSNINISQRMEKL